MTARTTRSNKFTCWLSAHAHSRSALHPRPPPPCSYPSLVIISCPISCPSPRPRHAVHIWAHMSRAGRQHEGAAGPGCVEGTHLPRARRKMPGQTDAPATPARHASWQGRWQRQPPVGLGGATPEPPRLHRRRRRHMSRTSSGTLTCEAAATVGPSTAPPHSTAPTADIAPDAQ
jgi:hypothetical protein|eukprot:COSAG01_NODE_2876_length_6927_cov_482.724810_3_plen_174_part_00